MNLVTRHMDRRQLPIVGLAVAAAGGDLWYLWPLHLASLLPFLLAVLLLAFPLWIWLPSERYGRIALVWLVGGLLGAYLFGVLVLAAGVVTTSGVGLRRSVTAAP